MDVNPQLRNWAAQQTCDGSNAAFDIKATDAATDFIYVTGVVLALSTHANGKTTSFIDSTPTTWFAYSDLTVAAGANQGQPIVWDFGKRGLKLAQGKKFQIHGDAAGSGPACVVVAYGYQSAL